MSRPEYLLAACGLVGFALALVGYYAGPQWLIGVGIFTTGAALIWLAVLAQRKPRESGTVRPK